VVSECLDASSAVTDVVKNKFEVPVQTNNNTNNY
jgi:hypothetical protein